MIEIFADLIRCQDALGRLEIQMELLYIALEQLEQPLNYRTRERVLLLLDTFRQGADLEIRGAKAVAQHVTASLRAIDRS